VNDLDLPDTIANRVRELGLHVDAFFPAQVAILDRRAFMQTKAKLRDASWSIVTPALVCTLAVSDDGDHVLPGSSPGSRAKTKPSTRRPRIRGRRVNGASGGSSPRRRTSCADTRTCCRSRSSSASPRSYRKRMSVRSSSSASTSMTHAS
jgi:hypothetical protein